MIRDAVVQLMRLKHGSAPDSCRLTCFRRVILGSLHEVFYWELPNPCSRSREVRMNQNRRGIVVIVTVLLASAVFGWIYGP
jgi:hypothetical protein